MTTESLKQLLEQKAAIAKKFREDGEKLVLAEVQKVFDENPKLLAVCWNQWAPYFNDGDPCIFGVHEMYATFGQAGEGETERLALDATTVDGLRESCGRWEGWEDSGSDEQCDAADLISARINDEDLLQSVFGDDCQVILCRGPDGKVVSYTHQIDHD